MEGIPQAYDGGVMAEPEAKKPALAPQVSAPIMPGFPMGAFPPMPPMPTAPMPSPYVTGQFFGARPTLTAYPGGPPQMKQPVFPSMLPRAFPSLPQSTIGLGVSSAGKV